MIERATLLAIIVLFSITIQAPAVVSILVACATLFIHTKLPKDYL